MSAFGVIVCPSCREHAQILELGGAKRTRCQKCGASLDIRKLRILQTSDSLEEAVSARTVLQARVHNLEEQMKSELAVRPATEENRASLVSDKPEMDPACLKETRHPPKRNPRQIILKLLRSNGGQLEIRVLEALALEHGVNEQQLETILEKMKSSGEMYEPSAGRLCLAE
ncbi:MAG: hypothetical protein PWP63_366 [Methanolobus sp.]|nr:hypothetical protein [Methanolobus sp.]